jgi:histidyl-tRNA synthetase
VALVAGDRDIEAGTLGVKDLSTGDQIDVALNDVVAEVVSKLR